MDIVMTALMPRVVIEPDAALPPRSSYLDYIPAVFRSRAEPDSADPDSGLLNRFLLAFEDVLSGFGDATQPGLEERIGELGPYLYPDSARTPEEFLPWMANWVALSLRADWERDRTVAFIREVIPLYRKRGTVAGLRRMLEIYLEPFDQNRPREDVEIRDDFDDAPFYFQVQLRLSTSDQDLVRRTQETARAIIDQEKPAHTFYLLRTVVPTMRLVSERLHADTGAPLLILGGSTVRGNSVLGSAVTGSGQPERTTDE